MAPIRVALIGLSRSAKTSWAAEAHLPYLLSPLGKSRYVIVALLNSSIDAAEAARDFYGLPPTVKAYGDPKKVAADPDVDLVVCCTRVDTHARTTQDAIRAGKAIYIEWPLAEDYYTAVTLVGAGPFENSIAGLQGRVSPVVLKLKEILAAGRIGRVLSSDVRAFWNLLSRDVVPRGLEYFTDRKVGGNPITIAYGHTIDYVHHLLGEFSSFRSRMQVQRPRVKIEGSYGSKGVEKERDNEQPEVVRSDVPDLLAVHGKLMGGKANIVEDATLSVTMRVGEPFKGSPGFSWSINGEKGEILVTASNADLQADAYDEPVRIQIHDHATNEVEDVDWDWMDWQKEIPVHSRPVAELYERYARWWESGKPAEMLPDEQEWPRLHDAVERMGEFQELFRQYDSQT